jgi:serine/threonine-protein kinase
VNGPPIAEPRIIGRYALYDEIAAGGMATVHLGRLLGPVGFSRTVAIKRLHPQFAKDPEFVAMFLDEARLAARIRHPNVVQTLDVVALEHELFLVMDYVQGESLDRMVRAARKREAPIPLNVVTTIMAGVLHGLHAAHEARTEQGEPLAIVHRDVSPQNVLVGADGVPRVLDFGVAKAAHRAQSTREGQVKGKIAYMAPEQLRSEAVDRRCDVFAAAAVLWEAVTRRRLYQADSDHAVLAMVLLAPAPSPRTVVPDLDENLERIIMRGLERDRDKRWPTAREMAIALENCLPLASASAVGSWVERLAGETLASRAQRISVIESSTSSPVVAAGLPAAIAAAAAASVPAAAASAPAAMPAAAAGVPATASVPATVVMPAVAEPAGRRADDVTAGSATLSSVSQPIKPRPRWALAAAAAGGVAILGGGALLLARGGSSGTGTGAGADTARAAVTVPASAVASAAPSAVASAAESASAAPEASASASAATPRSTALPAKRTPPPATAPPKPPSKPAGGCTPPYTVDAQGIRHMKPECL